jgi:hypothetical protein
MCIAWEIIYNRWRIAPQRQVAIGAYYDLLKQETFYPIDRMPPDLSPLDSEVGYDDATQTCVCVPALVLTP